MAKGQKHALQASEGPQHLPKIAEEDPQVYLGEEEMDAEDFRNLMAAMQVELAALRANQENVAETVFLQQGEIDKQKELEERQVELERQQREATMALEAALQLARVAQAATQQQTQQNCPPEVPEERPTQRSNVPPARPVRRESEPQQRSRGAQSARSPRCMIIDDQVLHSRGKSPSASRRQLDVHFAVRNSQCPPSAWESSGQCRNKETQHNQRR